MCIEETREREADWKYLTLGERVVLGWVFNLKKMLLCSAILSFQFDMYTDLCSLGTCMSNYKNWKLEKTECQHRNYESSGILCVQTQELKEIMLIFYCDQLNLATVNSK